MSKVLSTRGQKWLSDYRSAIPEFVDNVYNAETNPGGVISLALSENHLIHGPVMEFINKNFEIDEVTATTYSGSTVGGKRLRNAMASHVNRHFNPFTLVTAEEVICGNGVTALCSLLGFSLADEGDGLLLMTPSYGKFENDWTMLARMKTLYVDMGDAKPFSEDIVKLYEAKLKQAELEGINVRVLLLVNPHNPTGHCYPRSTLIALMKFCSAHNLHLVSDEIYALTVFPTADPEAPPFTSVMSIDPAGIIDPGLVHVQYGVSKDFGVPGLHVAAVITRSTVLQAAMKAVGLIHAPSGASCHIASLMLENTKFVDDVIGYSRSKLAENYRMVTNLLDAAAIGYWRGGNAGFFLWIDLSPFLSESQDAEEELARRVLDGGVFLNPAAEFAEKPGWFRLIYSQDAVKIKEGVRRYLSPKVGES